MKASHSAILSDSRSQEERSVQTLFSRLIPHQCSIIIFAQKALIFQNACKLFSELSNQHSGLLSTLSLIIKLWGFKINRSSVLHLGLTDASSRLSPMIWTQIRDFRFRLTTYNCVIVAECTPF